MTHSGIGNDRDNRYMRQALELAERGLYSTKPNPRVGCVIVKDDLVIGEGWHSEFGGPHAEVNAILNARCNPLDATAYITMEPCCHEGKTPPCVQFLFENGISKIIIGTLDPNPIVNGNGVKALKNLGIDVVIGILESEAKNVFFFQLVQPWCSQPQSGTRTP